ncbi:MAG: prepilin-type N-terminal cleavage/methylation domain-containing protein [Bradyrhizobium sp.]|uniref:PulJ/GspJ family protein n=1 Tax=Bradyrhizobium sp. TaxID=376 RepID=UPI00239519BB|nr:prepilin-type N-terminal cleavage/methylation domain-containing protein [Bradyrhizobium sp.]MDE2603336.1 prepilin-type N-terminal cleavage/methylation domain-containing protein [Bradyrhizobium sp.]
MSTVRLAAIDRPDAGFTILEVLIALAIVAASIVAIGRVMAMNTRGVRKLEEHLALMQTARIVLATAIPPRKDLPAGPFSGELRHYRWQVDVNPVESEFVAENAEVPWIPELVRVRVRSPSGATVELATVRLMSKAPSR